MAPKILVIHQTKEIGEGIKTSLSPDWDATCVPISDEEANERELYSVFHHETEFKSIVTAGLGDKDNDKIFNQWHRRQGKLTRDLKPDSFDVALASGDEDKDAMKEGLGEAWDGLEWKGELDCVWVMIGLRKRGRGRWFTWSS